MRQPLLRRNLDPGTGVCVSTLAYDYPLVTQFPSTPTAQTSSSMQRMVSWKFIPVSQSG